MSAAPVATPKYDMNLIKTFIEGTVDTMKVQCATEVQVGKPYRIDEGKPALEVELVGVIGLTSKTFNCTIALCFPAKSFLGVMSGMLGDPMTEINDDIKDGAGELLNIIFGYTKRILNKQGYAIEMAIPSVIYGKNIEVEQQSVIPPVVVPFTSSVGEFFVKIAIT